MAEVRRRKRRRGRGRARSSALIESKLSKCSVASDAAKVGRVKRESRRVNELGRGRKRRREGGALGRARGNRAADRVARSEEGGSQGPKRDVQEASRVGGRNERDEEARALGRADEPGLDRPTAGQTYLHEMFSSRPPSSIESLHLEKTVQRDDRPSPPLTSSIAGRARLRTGLASGDGCSIDFGRPGERSRQARR